VNLRAPLCWLLLLFVAAAAAAAAEAGDWGFKNRARGIHTDPLRAHF